MGRIIQPNDQGIDRKIAGHQSYLYGALSRIWELPDDSAWDCWPRIFRNQTNDGYVPEGYIGSPDGGSKVPEAQDFKELFFDDTKTVVSFYGIGETSAVKAGSKTAKVFLVFAVNIPKLKPVDGVAYVADEEIRNDVEKAVMMPRFNFNYAGMVLGVDNVFKEYSGWRKETGIKNRDMYPRHCFRLNFDVLYNVFDCR